MKQKLDNLESSVKDIVIPKFLEWVVPFIGAHKYMNRTSVQLSNRDAERSVKYAFILGALHTGIVCGSVAAYLIIKKFYNL